MLDILLILQINAYINTHFSASKVELYCCCAKAHVCSAKCLIRLLLLQKEAEDDTLSSKKVKELSVIDGRRAQNCNILLSRWVMLLALDVSLTYDSMYPEPSGFQTWSHILYVKLTFGLIVSVFWVHGNTFLLLCYFLLKKFSLASSFADTGGVFLKFFGEQFNGLSNPLVANLTRC